MQDSTIIIVLSVICVLLGMLSIAAIYFVYKFAKIIMVFEDDVSEVISELSKTEETINGVLGMPLFFDSFEVKQETQKILDQIKFCRFSVQKLIDRFTDRSKRKYVSIIEEEPEEIEKQVIMPRLPGQPPGTPNPLEMIYNHNIYNNNKGTVFDVGRFKK